MNENDDTDVIKSQQTGHHKKKEKKTGLSKIWVPGIRSFLCGAAFLILLLNSSIPFYKSIDNSLFSVSSGLKKQNKYKKNIVKIQLTPQEMDLLKNAPVNLDEFSIILKTLAKNKPLVSALFIDSYPDTTDNKYIKNIHERISGYDVINKSLSKKERNKLIRLAEKGQVKMFMTAVKKSGLKIILPVQIEDRQNQISLERLSLNDYLGVKNEFVTYAADKLPMSARPHQIAETAFKTSVNAMVISPVIDKKRDGFWPLVWKSGNRFVPDVCTLIYAEILKDKPVWEPGKGVWFGFSFLPTDLSGYIRPRYVSVADNKIKSFTLTQASRLKNTKIFKNSVVFIGGQNDAIMESAIRTLMCIETGSVSHTPVNAFWLEKILIIVFFLYLILLLPNLRPSVSFLVSVFFIFVLIVGLFGMHLVKDLWFQFTLPVLYLFFGHILMTFSLNRKKKVDHLQLKTESAFFKLGLFQYEQNRYDQAFESLKECRAEDRVIELLYKLGISLEQKRQYDPACSVFNYIGQIKPGYNDVRERADRLSNMIFGRTSANAFSDGGTLQIGTTGLSRPVLGRYEIEKELGRGAMGIVYLGTDPKIGRKIAIKTMDFTRTFEGRFEEVKDRFFREAKAAGRLTHPNIVTIYDAGEEQDLAYIAMDFVDGLTLSSCAREDSLLPVTEVFEIIYQAADALDYAHKQNIIHRDIKPANIIYDKSKETIVITDFGIARIADNTTTRPGIILGSPSFMSPEQLKGKEIDGRADIFSLGVTMYQLLTGKLPFKGADLSSLGYQITSVKHTSIRSVRPDLPASAERIINKSLQKSPDKRYQSAGSMARVLKSEIASMKA